MNKDEFLAAQRELEKEKQQKTGKAIWIFLAVIFGGPVVIGILILIIAAISASLR